MRTFKSDISETSTCRAGSALWLMYPVLLYVLPSSIVMTKSSAMSEARTSTCRFRYDSDHFNSRARTLSASDFSCAAKGSNRTVSTHKTTAEKTGMRTDGTRTHRVPRQVHSQHLRSGTPAHPIPLC